MPADARNIYTWEDLNVRLRRMNEAEALELFNRAVAQGASARWRKRIHARYRALRLKREKREVARHG